MSDYSQAQKDTLLQAYCDEFQSMPFFIGFSDAMHNTTEYFDLVKQAIDSHNNDSTFDGYFKDTPASGEEAFEI